MRGYVQVYTGDGKGKTTAALGLIVRAVGAGLRVFFVQFVKGRASSEIRTLRSRFPEVTVRQFGRVTFIRGKPSGRDVAAAERGFRELRRAVHSGRYDLVIADEANVALSLGLLDRDEMLSLVEDKPENVELIITGRGASRALIRRADLVTEMRPVKHYYDAGVKGRPGIES
jgi:cob(I)alamin adenosyltransferase